MSFLTLRHYPADAALGLENGKPPALARLVCLEGADESSYQKAEVHLKETGGIDISARQIQRTVQTIGAAAQKWQERECLKPEPASKAVPIMYVSGDGTGVPMRPEELEGRAGKQAVGTSKTRQAYLGCVFTQHKTDEKGHPVRDHDSTTYVSTFQSIDEFGPLLRQEAIRRGLPLALQVVLLEPRGWPIWGALFRHGYPNRGLLSRTRARREGAGGSFGQQRTSRLQTQAGSMGQATAQRQGGKTHHPSS